MEREIILKFSELDVKEQIELLFKYIECIREGMKNTGKALENVDINVALSKVYKRLEAIMEIK